MTTLSRKKLLDHEQRSQRSKNNIIISSKPPLYVTLSGIHVLTNPSRSIDQQEAQRVEKNRDTYMCIVEMTTCLISNLLTKEVEHYLKIMKIGFKKTILLKFWQLCQLISSRYNKLIVNKIYFHLL